jgi:hypothetical protein
LAFLVSSGSEVTLAKKALTVSMEIDKERLGKILG